MEFCAHKRRRSNGKGVGMHKVVSPFVHNWKVSYPHGITIGTDGSIYVTDSAEDCIRSFQFDGTFIRKLGGRGMGNGEFTHLSGLAIGIGEGVNSAVMTEMFSVHPLSMFPPGVLPICGAYAGDDYIVATDTSNHCVQVFKPDGTFVRKWGSGGQGDEHFFYPYDCDVGVDGVVYICDIQTKCIQLFDWNGQFLRKWLVDASMSPQSISVSTDGLVFIAASRHLVCYSAHGTVIRHFNLPCDGYTHLEGVCVDDEEGMIYVLDSGIGCIYQFLDDGTFVRQWMGDNEKLNGATAITKSKNGLLYIVDRHHHRIVAMSMT